MPVSAIGLRSKILAEQHSFSPPKFVAYLSYWSGQPQGQKLLIYTLTIVCLKDATVRSDRYAVAIFEPANERSELKSELRDQRWWVSILRYPSYPRWSDGVLTLSLVVGRALGKLSNRREVDKRLMFKSRTMTSSWS